jgi:hypothetical protein
MLALLVADRPGDVTSAFAALATRRSMVPRVVVQLKRLDDDLNHALELLLHNARESHD